MTRTNVWAVVLLAAALPGSSLRGQAPLAYSAYREPAPGVVTVVAGERYAAGRLHRTVFGPHYRDAWTTPIQVPVLDLAAYAGGLEPEEIGGGQQTRSLKLESEDGREFAFRGVDKDPSRALPTAYRHSVVGRVAQDATSAGHPGAPLIAAVVLDAVGVLHARPRLFVLPDDESLGQFRGEFGGMLGYLEERPDKGFRGSDEVVEWDDLLERLRRDPAERVDAREFLRARLVDHLLGDWDRHRDQWRWAGYRRDGRMTWRPVPRDRDQALVRYDGLLLGVARRVHPKLLNFGPRYPALLGLAWNAQELDRRLLSPLGRSEFEAVAREVQGAISDSVITSAVAGVPAGWTARHRDWLVASLRQRRDDLVAHAGDYYRFLAEEVNVIATDASELVESRRQADGRLTLVITSGGDTTFARTFDPRETGSVRLALLGAPDTVRLTGSGPGPLLEIEREPGVDTVIVASGPGASRLYDPKPAPHRVQSDSTASEQHPRDWGGSFGMGPRVEYDPDLGLLLGVQAARTDYAFHRMPYGSRVRLVAQYATAARGIRTDLTADIRRVDPRLRFELRARASEIEVVRFTGFGNETPEPQGRFTEVDQWQFVLSPAAVRTLPGGSRLEIGPVLKYVTSALGSDRLIDRDRPLGAEGFGRLGLLADVMVGGAETLGPDEAGARLTAGGSWYAPVWSADQAFGDLHFEAVGRLPVRIGPVPVLALRAGAKRVWGAFPYDEAAFVGGQRSLRGYDHQRFAGEASLYGSAELRVPLARVLERSVPTRIGVFAFGDAGRVWAGDDRSRVVHAAAGGGLWLSFFEERHTLSLAAADGAEGTRWYLRTGLAF